MRLLILIATMWAVNGLFFVVRSGSRGAFPDVMFGLFWPVFWYTDWRAGRWVYRTVDALKLISPSIVVLIVAVLAGWF